MPSPPRMYYSQRNQPGQAGRPSLDLPTAWQFFTVDYFRLKKQGYFAQAFGQHCVDDGFLPGTAGEDVAAYVHRKTWIPSVWPISSCSEVPKEAVFFTIVEFLFDHISKPTDSTYHDWDDCGYHHHAFDQDEGRAEWLAAMNDILFHYGAGYKLSNTGIVELLGPDGLHDILDAPIPAILPPERVDDRISHAIAVYRRGTSSWEDRRNAVRDLVDVLEFLRPSAKKALAKPDEQALFRIANQFWVRHNDHKQKTEYDQPTWLAWKFYLYLSSIHLVLRLKEKADRERASRARQ